MITQEYLRSIFDYQDGHLLWKNSRHKSRQGMFAGCIDAKNGYRRIQLHGKLYQGHRLIFMWHHGHMPDEVDHIDRNRLNNRIENLRSATRADNAKNLGINKANKSGVTGVYWNKVLCKWHAQIRVQAKTKHIGFYSDLAEAAAARKEAEMKNFGEFAPR